MNSWMSTPPSACAPPLRMLSIGTGRTCAFGPPTYRNSGRPAESAAAFATASETPRMALAPRLPLLSGAVEVEHRLVDEPLLGGLEARRARDRSARRRRRPPARRPCRRTGSCRRRGARPPRRRRSTRRTGRPRGRSCRRRAGPRPRRWGCRASRGSRGLRCPRWLPRRHPIGAALAPRPCRPQSGRGRAASAGAGAAGSRARAPRRAAPGRSRRGVPRAAAATAPRTS